MRGLAIRRGTYCGKQGMSWCAMQSAVLLQNSKWQFGPAFLRRQCTRSCRRGGHCRQPPIKFASLLRRAQTAAIAKSRELEALRYSLSVTAATSPASEPVRNFLYRLSSILLAMSQTQYLASMLAELIEWSTREPIYTKRRLA